jgi:hypothetical protein
MVTTAEGNPVEVSLTPGSYSDTKHLRTWSSPDKVDTARLSRRDG